MDDLGGAADALVAGFRIALERGAAHPQRQEGAVVMLALLALAVAGLAIRLRSGKG